MDDPVKNLRTAMTDIDEIKLVLTDDDMDTEALAILTVNNRYKQAMKLLEESNMLNGPNTNGGLILGLMDRYADEVHTLIYEE